MITDNEWKNPGRRKLITAERVHKIIKDHGPIRQADICRIIRRRRAVGKDVTTRRVITCVAQLERDGLILRTILPDRENLWNAL